MYTRYAMLFAILLTCTVPYHASADPPDGWEIVDITDEVEFVGSPSMNNLGQIVYSKRQIPNPNGDFEDIYLYDNGKVTRLTDDNVRDDFPQINDAGAIVWRRGRNEDAEIVRWDDGEIVSISGPTPPGIVSVTMQALGNDGTVVWGSVASSQDIQAFRYHNGEITQLTDNGMNNQFFQMNDAGDIVWQRTDFSVNPWQSTIMLWREGEITELNDGVGYNQGPDINDVGQIGSASRLM